MRRLALCLALTLPTTGFAQDLSSLDGAALRVLRPASEALVAAGRRYNPEAPIPPQCYTRIEGRFNPCYVCHQTNEDATRPNFMLDGGLQAEYAFSEAGLTNHHVNLFIDRSAEVAAISDAEIRDWIGQDSDLAQACGRGLRRLGAIWPVRRGAAAFDARGLALDGSWWVAFNYKRSPRPSWPTNGSTDDVLIRLPTRRFTLPDGHARKQASISPISRFWRWRSRIGLPEVTVPPLDEAAIGVDLDGDGALGQAGRVLARASYLGGAADQPVTLDALSRGHRVPAFGALCRGRSAGRHHRCTAHERAALHGQDPRALDPADRLALWQRAAGKDGREPAALPRSGRQGDG
ncbi:MAG: hypothetical protein R3D78_08095 [Paracoccaceae bacterium]